MEDRFLSPDERAERDHLFVVAGIDPQTNRPRRNDEIKDQLLDALRSAEQAGRGWASWLMEEALRDGLLKAWKRWDDTHNARHTVGLDGVSHSVASRRGMRSRTEDGRVVYRREQVELMTREDLELGLDGCDARIGAELINREMFLRLLKLMDRAPTARTPVEACELLGEDLDDVLRGEESA